MFIYNMHRIILVLIVFILLVIPAQIAGEYKFRVDFPTGDGPHAIGAADLDGDGDIDVITANYYNDNVSVLLNDGKGMFAESGQYWTDDGPRSLAIGDIDSDGDSDVITANWHGDTVSVLRNNGDGTFASQTTYDVDAGPYSVYLADIGEDANGDMDVIVAADQADRVSVLENDGTGSFGNLKSLKVGARPKGVFAADVDGDGYNDIACINWADSTVSVLINKGDGTFFKHKEYDTGSSPRGMYMAPVNNDLWLDVVCANQHDNTVSVIMNNGDGTFGTATDYEVGANPLSVYCGDADSDGDSDILSANLLNDSVTVLYNDGNGNFPDEINFETGWGPYEVLMAEVNWDDKVDIITSNNYGDSISVRYSNIPPAIMIFEPDGSGDTTNATYTITWGDFDPDEDAEITLYWDDDDSGLDGTVIAQGISEDNDGSGGSYLWDTADLPEGDYWIYARIQDGVFEPVHEYSSGSLTVDRSFVANSPPTFHFTEPNGQNDFADGQFAITWTDSDPDDDAAITLYYDREGDAPGEILIMDGLSEDMDGNSGFYTWDTSALPDGQYYLSAVCHDGHNDPVNELSPNPVIVNHTKEQNDAPLILILEPDGMDDHAHTAYMITWIDSDADSDAQISLYYDTDSSGYDGTLIAEGIDENDYGGSGAYIWDTSMLAEGTYYIYGLITDSENDARDYSPGAVAVSHNGTFNTAPSILEISPLEGEDTAHENYTIQWLDLDPDDDAAISLYYDSDQVGYDGVLIVSGISEDDETDSYNWDTRDVPEGRYFIYGTIDDGTNRPTHDYSHGTLQISHDSGDGDEVREESLIGYCNNQFGLCLSLLFVLILVLAIFLFMRTRKEKDQLNLLLYQKTKKEKAQAEPEDFPEEGHEESDNPEQGPPSEGTEDEIDEDLLPPPDDEMHPPTKQDEINS